MAGEPNRKSVIVKFVGDDEVLEEIIYTNRNAECSQTISSQNEKDKYLSFKENDRGDLVDIQPLESESYCRPSVLLNEDDDIDHHIVKQANGTKKMPPKHKVTPIKIKKSSMKIIRTSNRLRGATSYKTQSSDNDSNIESTTSDEDEDVPKSKSVSRSANKTNLNQKRSFRNMAEEYFLMRNMKTFQTSNRTLSSSALETDQEMLKKVRQGEARHSKHIQKLTDKYQHNFPKWNVMLREGFNLLFYGVGTKLALIETFCKEILQDHLHMVVHGFFPGLTLKNLVNTITEEIIGDSGSYQGLNDKIKFIHDYFNTPDAPNFFLVVHNIDGTALQSEKAQSILNHLAQASKIHLIASVDYVNCSLLWDQVMLSRFRWVWFEVTTFQPYVTEVSYEDSLLAQHSGQLKLTSLNDVFHSVNSNAQGIFLLIANNQIAQSTKQKYLGLSFQDCYMQCGEAFLVSSDQALRTQLIEFKDHKLLQIKKGADGVEYLYIPLDNDTLKQFIEQEKET